MLGLGFHVAFLRVREGGAVQLVHSSYVGLGAVVRKAADTSEAPDVELSGGGQSLGR